VCTTRRRRSTGSVWPSTGPAGARPGCCCTDAGSVATSLAERAPRPEDRIAAPATVLWPEHDPLFPRDWSDRLGEFFAEARLVYLDGAGHFTPREAAGDFAAAVIAAVRSSPR
jgi:pimeloyl-ACP methyl ester carboxylesterase